MYNINSNQNNYNETINSILNSSKNNVRLFTGFTNRTITISRLCYPEAIYDREKYTDQRTGQIAEKKILKKAIGLNIIVRSDNGSSIQLTVPCTDEVFDEVLKKSLYIKFNTIFKLDFDNTGTVVKIHKLKNNSDFENQEYFDNVDDSESSFTRFNMNDDSSGIDNHVNNLLSNRIILKIEKNKASVFASDSNIPDSIIKSIEKAFSGKNIKDINALDAIDNPKAIVTEVRSNFAYISLL